MTIRSLAAACCAVALSASAASAQSLHINLTEKSQTYSVSQLEKEFGPAVITTVSTWTNGQPVTYTGIKLSDLLAKHDIRSELIAIAAENGYESTVPTDMVAKYQPILAFTADGQPLDFSMRGPISLIWPRSDFPNDLDETTDGMWTWYANKISPVN